MPKFDILYQRPQKISPFPLPLSHLLPTTSHPLPSLSSFKTAFNTLSPSVSLSLSPPSLIKVVPALHLSFCLSHASIRNLSLSHSVSLSLVVSYPLFLCLATDSSLSLIIISAEPFFAQAPFTPYFDCLSDD
jgi:hypothetical protein